METLPMRSRYPLPGHVAWFLLIGSGLSAQNLVPNPDFEQHTGCPPYYSYLSNAVPWFDPSIDAAFGSSDYLHTCATYWEVSVPNNFLGEQDAHSGHAYAGLYAFSSTHPNYREYIEVALDDTLQAGACYTLSVYVSLGGCWKAAVADMGAYFSVGPVLQTANGPIPVVPQLDHLGGMLNDTLNWTELNGVFEASGGETHLVIGNFHDDATTTVFLLDSAATIHRSYYYIDDVSLLALTDPCGPEGVLENGSSSISVFPNPAFDRVSIRTAYTGRSHLILRDAAGRAVHQEDLTGATQVDLSGLRAGVYVWDIRHGRSVVERGRLFKY
jgi:hypothetical protein